MAVMKTTRKYGYPRYDNKIRTSRVPLIGFEWEIARTPPDEVWDDYEECYVYVGNFAVNDKFLRFCTDRGLQWHFECGCLEIASPVANTVEVARRAAKDLIQWAEKEPGLSMEDVEGNEGGIHVSVSRPRGGYTEQHFQNIMGMLNRKSSYDFIWEFSGRNEQSYNSEYESQGEPSCWDHYGDQEPRHYNMFRAQEDRIEYRLWANFPEYLVPAIEFAHSTFIFCEHKKEIPYLKDYKAWLFKQKGYKTLKEFAPWNLI